MNCGLRKVILNPLTMLVCGLSLGTAARLFDIYTQNLGDIFSQMAVWVLLGTLIAIYSPTRVRAMINILPFCLGMLATYYITATLTKNLTIWYINWNVIKYWTVFAFLSPFAALIVWQTKEKGISGKIIGVGVVLFSVLTSVIMFGGPRFYDFIIDGLLIYFLFFKKIERPKPNDRKEIA